MPINPTFADIGRRVVLRVSGGAVLKGVLKEVCAAEFQRPDPFARVVYDGDRFPISTEIEKLEWEKPSD